MSQILFMRITLSVLTVFALFVCGARAQATDISGTISTTMTIYDDSELVGDVTCMVAGAPCIAFGAPGIKLRLNGFTITGRANPPDGCTPTAKFPSEDGIDVVGQHDVAIFGPGLVQKFASVGILLRGATKGKVAGVTASDNCFSGILLISTTDSDIEKNISVRNSIGSQGLPCGGT